MDWISNDMLPVIFLGLMGLAMLLYAILDGYDLGPHDSHHWAILGCQ